MKYMRVILAVPDEVVASSDQETGFQDELDSYIEESSYVKGAHVGSWCDTRETALGTDFVSRWP